MYFETKNKESHFKPAWWLKNNHLQTLFPVLFSSKKQVSLFREDFYLPDGDLLQLDWSENYIKNNKPILVLLHGLEGSSSSPYIQRTMQSAFKLGFIAVCMHFRGCGGLPNKLPRAYHAGETEDLNFFLKSLIQNSDMKQIYVVGFSLGGNVLLKWLGENPDNKIVKSAVAVSVPFELSNSASKMNKGVSKFYQWWLIKSLKESILNKNQFQTLGMSKEDIHNLKNFWEFDDKITAKLHGFKDVQDYYKKSSSRQFLKKIKTPTLIIHSQDDPFMTSSCIPKKEELSNSIHLEVTDRGGHIGFITGNIPFCPHYWLEERVLKYLTEVI
jgi:predicted alpha/beta-fold hydrolase